MLGAATDAGMWAHFQREHISSPAEVVFCDWQESFLPSALACSGCCVCGIRARKEHFFLKHLFVQQCKQILVTWSLGEFIRGYWGAHREQHEKLERWVGSRSWWKCQKDGSRKGSKGRSAWLNRVAILGFDLLPFSSETKVHGPRRKPCPIYAGSVKGGSVSGPLTSMEEGGTGIIPPPSKVLQWDHGKNLLPGEILE